jgi:tetratricopeptide (TPR) repeat protein
MPRPSHRPGRAPGRARRLSRLALALALAVAPVAVTACGSSSPPPAAPLPEGPIVPAAVSDARFAEAVHELLRNGDRTPARLAVLAGAVRRQLAHAADRFARGQDADGAERVIGALFLVRSGEARAEMIDEAGSRALGGVVAWVSARGDEGRAGALLRMQAAALPEASPARAEALRHLAALERWTSDTRSIEPAQALGDAARVAVARTLVDPSDEALAVAARALDKWIGQAIEYNMRFQESGLRPSRDEAIESERALETGAITMAAIYLRHGDARGAAAHVEDGEARRVLRPSLRERLRAAAEEDGAREWRDLAQSLLHGEHREPGDSFTMTDEVFAAALWGATLEAYRRDPTHPASGALLARLLGDLGLPEVAPLVLADAIGVDPSAGELGLSLREAVAALDRAAASDDLAEARRVFQASQRLLALAEQPERRGRVEPSAARVRAYMASVEFRAGDLAAARPLLEAALREEPSASGFTQLATLERQSGRPAAALEHLGRALSAPDASGSALDAADAHALAFEIHRDAGDAASANAALERALRAVLAARQQPSSPSERARAERLLGRVLDGYGDAPGARRALERAIEIAAGNRPALSAAMLDAVGRALVRRDVASARAAIQRGIDADVSEEDLVYVGLWLHFLERDLGVKPDGTVDRALRVPADRSSWTAKLAAWASGKLSDTDLGTLAQSPAQKIEARFYAALAGKVAGQPTAAAELRAVAESPVIDLLEVQLAREMVATPLRAELPRNVSIP